jgi:hypothetical protein
LYTETKAKECRDSDALPDGPKMLFLEPVQSEFGTSQNRFIF